MNKKNVLIALTAIMMLLLGNSCSQDFVPVSSEAVSSEEASLNESNAVSRAASSVPTYAQEVTSGPKRDRRWGDSTSLSLDRQLLGVKIVAYRIRWFSGAWSPWYVPGVNDLYRKPYEPLRRVWAHFNDHTHQYLYIPAAYAYSLRSYRQFDKGVISRNIQNSGIKSWDKNPARNTVWGKYLSINLDRYLYRQMIVAYRITWFSGAKSGWFIPGYKDIYQKPGENRRRWWAHFNDHSHEYISFSL